MTRGGVRAGDGHDALAQGIKEGFVEGIVGQRLGGGLADFLRFEIDGQGAHDQGDLFADPD